MNLDLRYYLSIFLRRLPLFILIAGLISGLAVFVAIKLPPAYVSSTRLTIESAQIPSDMATPTVQTPPEEQMQLLEARLLTRDNMLAIARKLNVLAGQAEMSADEIVNGMRARTSIRSQGGRNQASVMTISFEARTAQIAAGVLNEYLTRIIDRDTSARTERAGQTQDFFTREVARLSEELDIQSAKILKFKNENADALPDSLDYRRNQQLALQERIAQADREIASLREQRDRLVQVFNATGMVSGVGGKEDLRSPDEIQLEALRRQLSEALLVYSAENPKVKLLQARIEQLEGTIAAAVVAAPSSATETSETLPSDPTKAMLDLQLAQIDSRIAALQTQKTSDQAHLEELNDSIARTPANAIVLDAMQRDFDNFQAQYNAAVARLAQASTGERIELLSRGQRIAVLEQPSIPSEPTKPNRLKLAILGVGLGIAAGAGLILLLETLNNTVRRPADLVARLGIGPIATIPYMRTRREVFWNRLSQTMMVLLVLIAVPAALAAVHVYYMPLDLLADRIMSKLGIRG